MLLKLILVVSSCHPSTHIAVDNYLKILQHAYPSARVTVKLDRQVCGGPKVIRVDTQGSVITWSTIPLPGRSI